MKGLWLIGVILLTHGLTCVAYACGTCTVGDPTLTVVGFGQPANQRVRTSFTTRHRQDQVGEPGVDELTLSEQRLEMALAYSFTDRWTVSLMMPVVHRLVTEVNLAELNAWAPGDLDLRLRSIVYRDRKFAPRHVVGLLGGLEMPTGTVEDDLEGEPLPLEFQAGSGSWDPLAGASYAFYANPWALFLSSSAIFPTEGTADTQAGISFRQTANAQYQPIDYLAFVLGADFRLDRPTYEAGFRDPDTGGNITYLNVGMIGLPHPKLVLHAMVSVPIIQRLDGLHEEFVAVTAGLIYETR